MTAARYWPTGIDRILTSPFGRSPERSGFHWGADFGRSGGPAGMPVYAAQAGWVTNAGPADGFGLWVVLDHPTEFGAGTTVYGHVVPEVGVGDWVAAGQRIARINGDRATMGDSTGPHLHFEVHADVWRPPGPGRLDPMAWLDGAREPEGPHQEEDDAMDIDLGLTPERLADVMGRTVHIDRYRELFPAVVECLISCGCWTAERAAMWHAQVGHEGGGLRHMREIASGEDYEGRRDLGNIHPGDGIRYAGRGPIQVTGRNNYTALSRWAYDIGRVPTPTFFVDNPEALERLEYGFLGVTWYWTTQRPMNRLADALDIEGATRAVNGGTNGLADRTERWRRALALGVTITPGGDIMATIDEIADKVVERLLGHRPAQPDGSTDATLGELWTWADWHAAVLVDQECGPKSKEDRGPGFNPTRWDFLGTRTVPEAVAAIGIAVRQLAQRDGANAVVAELAGFRDPRPEEIRALTAGGK